MIVFRPAVMTAETQVRQAQASGSGQRAKEVVVGLSCAESKRLHITPQ
jgi:hypothetical protein